MKTIHLQTNSPQILTFIAVFLLMTSNFKSHAFFDFQQQLNSYKAFKGTVYDAQTKTPLTFADISVIDTNISTITNTEGEFLLKIPDNLLNATVSFSFLGYSEQKIKISDLTNHPKIYLQPNVTSLTEVNLTAPESALSLVEATLKRKGENYINEQKIMTGFYRETIKKRNKNASLSEAVVEIYKQSYQSRKGDKVRLIKARKNTDYTKLDTIALKLQGGPFSTLYVDMIKYNQFIFNEDNLSNYDFSFENSTQIDNRKVYVVNFKQKPQIQSPLYFGKLYIDTENYALISAIYNLNVTDAEAASKLFIKKKPNKVRVLPTEAAYRVDYKTQNGKWHYRYSNIQLAFKVNWKGKLFNSNYTLNSEMAITDWQDNNSKVLSYQESFKPSMILSDEASGFSDPQFWGEYNIIEPEKSIESAIKKINKQLAKN